MASVESQALRSLYEELGGRLAANPEMDMPTMRDVFECLHRPASEAPGVSYADEVLGGVPCLRAIPADAADAVILYLHGGGYFTGSTNTHRKLAGHLAAAVGVPVVVPDYRLTPEHPFPAQIDDTLAVHRALVAAGTPAERIAFAGDSSGGGLALGLALKLRELGEDGPVAVVGFSPLLDLQVTGDSVDAHGGVSDVLVSRQMPEGVAAMYVGENGSRTDPIASPFYADPALVPPLYLAAGESEALVDDSRRFAEKVRAAGGDVELELVPDMQHVHVFMAGRAPEADETLRRVGAWLRPRLNPTT